MISVFASKEDNVYGEGEEIALNVVYTHAMDVLGTPAIPLNSGGEALFSWGGRRQVCIVMRFSGYVLCFYMHLLSGVFIGCRRAPNYCV